MHIGKMGIFSYKLYLKTLLFPPSPHLIPPSLFVSRDGSTSQHSFPHCAITS